MAQRPKTGKPKPKRRTRSKDKPSRVKPSKRNGPKKPNGKDGDPWHRAKPKRHRIKVPPQRPGVRARR